MFIAAVASVVVEIVGIILYILSENESYTTQVHEPTQEYKCGILDYLSYSFIKEIFEAARKNKVLEIEDVPQFIDKDTSSVCFAQVMKKKLESNSLLLGLFEPIKKDFMAQVIFQLLRSFIAYCGPLSLQCILYHVSQLEGTDSSTRHAVFDFNPYIAAFLMFMAPFSLSILDGQIFHIAKRNEMKVRGALTAILYEKSLHVDLTYLAEGVGTVNNLISVDVAQIMELCSINEWIGCFLEIIICLVLLSLVMGPSALSGVTVMILSIPFGGYVAKYLDKYQNELLEKKDERMSVITEVLNGMRIVKVRHDPDSCL